ncbi:MAG: response regulator, partial [Pseudomonadota bacterium]
MNEHVTARILIVDDNLNALKGLTRIIRSAGHIAIEASNGSQCLTLAKTLKPDLILLDVMLPDIDGRDVCKILKSDPETSGILVVMLSSLFTESEIQSAALELGADGYIARPVPNRELLARVNALIRIKFTERMLEDALA